VRLGPSPSNFDLDPSQLGPIGVGMGAKVTGWEGCTPGLVGESHGSGRPSNLDVFALQLGLVGRKLGAKVASWRASMTRLVGMFRGEGTVSVGVASLLV
jgi:hypothetical protein